MENIKQIQKIDIHAHANFFPDYVPPFYKGERFMSQEELIDQYDQLGIEKGILMPLVAAEGFANTITSEACKAMADRYPDRFYWFCGVDPRAAGNHTASKLDFLLDWYKSLGAKGCGEITANIYADDPRMDRLFSACEELDMPAIFHLAPSVGMSYGIVDELHLPRIENMLKKHPKLKLIGHSTTFWSEISGDVTEQTRKSYATGKVAEGKIAQLLRDYENFSCDLSAESGSIALMRDPEYTAKFVDEFSDRLMYGSDQCLARNRHSYKLNAFLEQMVADGMISPENYGKIVRYNAERILKL